MIRTAGRYHTAERRFRLGRRRAEAAPAPRSTAPLLH